MGRVPDGERVLVEALVLEALTEAVEPLSPYGVETLIPGQATRIAIQRLLDLGEIKLDEH